MRIWKHRMKVSLLRMWNRQLKIFMSMTSLAEIKPAKTTYFTRAVRWRGEKEWQYPFQVSPFYPWKVCRWFWVFINDRTPRQPDIRPENFTKSSNRLINRSLGPEIFLCIPEVTYAVLQRYCYLIVSWSGEFCELNAKKKKRKRLELLMNEGSFVSLSQWNTQRFVFFRRLPTGLLFQIIRS